MAKCIMVQGTTSNAGKSLTVAALCRIFAQDGYRTAPFKSQNMALNSFITADGKEMGRAQVVQAEAAGLAPDVRMNPILLKPTSDCGSQVIVNGTSIGNMRAAEYFRYKTKLIPDIMAAYNSLAAENDIIVIEGAGSPAEINLKAQDIVNMGLAKLVDAPVILVGDIDRGGVFASLYGTVELLEPDERARIKGLVINKFRGDPAILAPGLHMLEDKIHIPFIGVVPYLHVDIDDEDSLSERLDAEQGGKSLLDLAVIRLPRLSNFTDFDPLGRQEGVSLRYVSSVEALGRPDLILLPGSKNTMGDLLWMRQNGLEAEIKKYAASGGLVMGICGGYQMMGRTLSDPLGVEHGGTLEGIGLLPMHTEFAREKTTSQVTGVFAPVDGAFSALSGQAFSGYEIHMGSSAMDGGAPLTRLNRTGQELLDGMQYGNCLGTYVHGIFDSDDVRRALVRTLLRRKGLDEKALTVISHEEYRRQQYDLLADSVRQALDMDAVYGILDLR
ncbi:MAG: cobyric acid synthase [Butyricicoccaceae bacterium]